MTAAGADTAELDASVPARRDPLPAQPLPHARRRGAGRRRPAVAAAASTSARRSSCSSATARRLGRARRGARAAARRAGARGRRRRGAAHRRARRPRAQPAARPGLARAGRRARGGRARRAAPAQLPAGLRGRHLRRPAGGDCTRCHGRDTLPGVRLNCRGSRAEAAGYAAALALWQRRLVGQRRRARRPERRSRASGCVALGAPRAAGAQRRRPLRARRRRAPRRRPSGAGALVVVAAGAREGRRRRDRRLRASPGLPLDVVRRRAAGGELRAHAARRAPTCASPGASADDELARLRAGARVALVPSRADETFGLVALRGDGRRPARRRVARRRAGRAATATCELAPPGDAARARAGARSPRAAEPGAGRRALGRRAPPRGPRGGRPRALAAVYESAS